VAVSRDPTVVRLDALAAVLGAELVGPGDREIRGIASLEGANPEQVSHLSNGSYRDRLAATRAGAVILAKVDLPLCPTAALVVDNPYLAYARASALFAVRPAVAAGVHPGSVVDPSASIHPTATLGPGVVVGAHSRVGAGARLHANVVVGERCSVGEGSELHPGVVLYADVSLGARVVLHAGAVVGSDGFGFAPDERGRWVAIAQLGGVVIGDDVCVGAGTTIDRGALDDTVIEEGVKIDNQVQIGHNVRIGAHSLICGCVGIVGSTRIGMHCVLAGGVGIGGDRPITLCDGVIVSGMTHISSSINEPGVYSGGVLHNGSITWKRNAIRFQSLDQLARRVSRLERSREQRDPDVDEVQE
jgi:UDP-3-O-[3-hydroxymyristoyl] glucosamine N-acyltransferase